MSIDSLRSFFVKFTKTVRTTVIVERSDWFLLISVSRGNAAVGGGGGKKTTDFTSNTARSGTVLRMATATFLTTGPTGIYRRRGVRERRKRVNAPTNIIVCKCIPNDWRRVVPAQTVSPLGRQTKRARDASGGPIYTNRPIIIHNITLYQQSSDRFCLINVRVAFTRW